jgi:hypothetical protein
VPDPVSPGEQQLTVPPTNVTVVGAFNPAILRPDWLSRKIFESVGPYEMLLAANGAAVLQRRGDLTWWVQQDRLVAAANNIASAADFVTKILRTLPHTPVQAVGINFQIGATVSLTGTWFRRLSDLKTSSKVLDGKRNVTVVLRAAREDRTTVTMSIRELALPLVTLEFNFNRDAPPVAEEELRVNDLIDYIKRVDEFENEATKLASEVSSG